MEPVLQQLIQKIDEYIGSLIDVAEMSTDDKALLKSHLLAVQEILVRNGNDKLQELVNGIAGAILKRF